MIWLNQAATSFPKPEEVYCARDRYFRLGLAGHNRGSGQMDTISASLILQTRDLLAEMFTSQPSDVFLTSGATEALNIIFANMPRDGLAVSTQSRHNAVRRPLHAGGFRQKLLPPLTLENYRGLLREALEENSLLVLNACSNVNGHCEPLAEICAFVKKNLPSVKIAVDGAQAAGHMPIRMDWGIDYLALTAHKGLYGPAGMGALISPCPLKPLIFGGTGAHSEALDQGRSSFEAGTRDGASIGAWAESLNFVRRTGIDTICAQEHALKERFIERIRHLPVSLYTAEGAVVSLVSPEFSSGELAELLESRGVAVRGGMHCAPDMHSFLKIKGAARFSFGWFNTPAEIDEAAAALQEILGGGA